MYTACKCIWSEEDPRGSKHVAQ